MDAKHRDETNGTDRRINGRRRATNSDPARFLEDVDGDTPLDELADAYADWRRRHALDTEQATVTGWSE